jgi:hypothetical protein
VVVANAQPLASRVFDWSVLGVAALLTLLAAVLAVRHELDGGDHPHLTVAVLVGLPVMVLVSRYPVALDRPGGAIEIGYDSFVLAFLGTLLSIHDAAWIWALGAVLAAALARHRWAATVFNIGVQTTCGIVALWVIGTLGTDDLASLQQLGAVVAGCVVYFVLDFVISEISVGLENDTPFNVSMGQSGVLVSMASVVAVDSLGYSSPPW